MAGSIHAVRTGRNLAAGSDEEEDEGAPSGPPAHAPQRAQRRTSCARAPPMMDHRVHLPPPRAPRQASLRLTETCRHRRGTARRRRTARAKPWRSGWTGVSWTGCGRTNGRCSPLLLCSGRYELEWRSPTSGTYEALIKIDGTHILGSSHIREAYRVYLDPLADV